MVRMVSSSAGEGPGPLISRGFTERRFLSSSRASGIGIPMVSRRQAATQSAAHSDRSVRALHIRRRGLIDQRGQRFVRWHHCLAVASKPPDRNRMGLGFLLADYEQRRNFCQRMFADLVVDLLVAQA